MTDHAAPHVFLRPIGSPLTIGMAGLGIASLVQSGLDLGWMAPTEVHKVGLILISVPFVLQLLASVFSYLARDGATGASVGVIATTWLGLGLLEISSRPGQTSTATGLLLLAAGGVVTLSALAIGPLKPLPATVFAVAALRFVFAGVYHCTTAGFWQDFAGIVGLVVVGLAAYCVLAFELEDQRHRPLLPTFRRGAAAAAMDDGASPKLDGVLHEAGVRQTT
jgi:succinate-acetate transporter protein